MRADLILTALADESNRYQLTKSVAKVTRMLHRPNTRVQDTMNETFKWFGCFKPGAAEASITPKDSATRTPALRHDPAFDQIQAPSMAKLGVSTWQPHLHLYLLTDTEHNIVGHRAARASG